MQSGQMRVLVVLAVLLSATACTDDGKDPGDAVDLPTSEWTPGNGGDSAGIPGVLSLDSEGCVYLDNEGQQIWAVWPKGFTARDPEGRLELMDPSGDVVAVEGDELFLGGGYTKDYAPLTGTDCIPDGVEMALVQSNIDGSNT